VGEGLRELRLDELAEKLDQAPAAPPESSDGN
jgi:hypothetical protein